MVWHRCWLVGGVAVLASGCAVTIAPTYTSQKPDIMRIGGDRPENAAPMLESTGSFCVETTEHWHENGKTPDGQMLWTKDTLRRVLPCK